MAGRLGHNIFAGSASVRRLCNEPPALTRLILGLEEPLPMDEAVQKLHEALPSELPTLVQTSPYHTQVCAKSAERQQDYPDLHLDELKALVMFSLDNPRYYDLQNTVLYKTYADETHPRFKYFTDIVGHLSRGFLKLARLHRQGRETEHPQGLVRLAWIPTAVLDQHFYLDNQVVFKAPMSAAPLWKDADERNKSPVWGFLTPAREDCEACLLEFDYEVARQSAQLGHPTHPLSVFGAAEQEWTLPCYLRGRVVAVGTALPPACHGRSPVRYFKIQGLSTIPMSSGPLYAAPKSPAGLLIAAATVAALMEDELMTDALCALHSSLSRAVKIKCPELVMQQWMSRATYAGLATYLASMTVLFAGMVALPAVATVCGVTAVAGAIGLPAAAKCGLIGMGDKKDEVASLAVLGATFPLMVPLIKSGHIAAGIVEAQGARRSQEARDALAGAGAHLGEDTIKRLGLQEGTQLSMEQMQQLASNIPVDLEQGPIRKLMAECKEGSMEPMLKLRIHMHFIGDIVGLVNTADLLVDEGIALRKVEGRAALAAVERVGAALWETNIEKVQGSLVLQWVVPEAADGDGLAPVASSTDVDDAVLEWFSEMLGVSQDWVAIESMRSGTQELIGYTIHIPEGSGGPSKLGNDARRFLNFGIGDHAAKSLEAKFEQKLGVAIIKAQEGKMQLAYKHGPYAPGECAERHAWCAAAWLDVASAILASTRVLVVLGAPDAGKTTLLRQVFRVDGKAGLREECRNSTITFHKHPRYNKDFSPAYVADTPGFGDTLEERNNLVRMLVDILSTLASSAKVVWVCKVDRATHSFQDDLFELILPFCSMVVFTHVDEVVKKHWMELGREMWKNGIKDEDVLKTKRAEMMRGIRDEAIGRLHELCGERPVPQAEFAVLAAESWASAEPLPEDAGPFGREQPPPGWKGAAADEVVAAFGLKSASELQRLLDKAIGLE